MKKLVNELIKLNKTISTMESCTGGGVVNAITNIEGASSILKYSAVTYSNEFKIKMGVNKDTIDKYTVYSEEVAKEMSKCISLFTDSNFGIGVTGKINKPDPSNYTEDDSVIYISIYDKEKDNYETRELHAIKATRKKNKEMIIDEIVNVINNML